jgi:hypothetical protein
MRVKLNYFLSFFALFTTCYGMSYASTPFSKYGIIQNVQNYSTSPFWNTNSPYYNATMPQAVYVTGPSITTDECLRIITSLVTVQCMSLNNCINTELSDIRPAIIIQLSRMTGGNYATACGGYLDGVFEEYVKKYANAAPRLRPVAFPTAITPNSTTDTNQIEIKNPFAPQQPDWAKEIEERKQELQELRSQTDSLNSRAGAVFPATYADISFTERKENATKDYAAYANTSAYRSINIEADSESLKKKTTEPERSTCVIEKPKKINLDGNQE